MSYRKTLLIVLLPSLYHVIRSSTGILAKPYSWRIASLCLVGISSRGWWVKSRGGVVGGIGVKLGGENHSLKTQTYEAGLVRR
jgi:hypothetical protein